MRLMLFRRTAVGMSLLPTDIPNLALPILFCRACTENQSLVRAFCCSIREKPVRRVSRKRRGRLSLGVASHAKTCAAFRTTGGNHCTAALGFHTNQETVGALSFGYGRLIGALHDRILCETVEKRAITNA